MTGVLKGGALVLAVLLAAPVLAAEVELTPSITVSEEFNDNVGDSATDRRSDFITRLQPGAAATLMTPWFNGDLRYNFDRHDYARNVRGDESNHYVAFKAGAALLNDFLFLELSDVLSRVSLDVTRDTTTESLHSRQGDRNVGDVHPYLRWRPGGKSTLVTGYRFTDTSYWDSPGVDRRENKGHADLTYEPFNRMSLTAGYSFASVRTDLVDYDQHDASTGLRYEYAQESFLYGGFGRSWQSFADGRSVGHPFWHAGVTRAFRFGVATLDSRVHFTDDPLAVSTKETIHSLRLEKLEENQGAGFSASFSTYEETATEASKRRRAGVGGFMRRELLPRLGLSLVVAGDRVTRTGADDYPYHFSCIAGLSYLFNYGISTAFSYSYIDYRHALTSLDDARQTNRIVLAITKAF